MHTDANALSPTDIALSMVLIGLTNPLVWEVGVA